MAARLFKNFEWCSDQDELAAGCGTTCLALSHSETFVAFGYTEERLRVEPRGNAKEEKSIKTGDSVRVGASVFNVSSARWLGLGLCSRSLRVSSNSSTSVATTVGDVTCLAWSPRDDCLYGGTAGGFLIAWDVCSTQCLFLERVCEHSIVEVHVSETRPTQLLLVHSQISYRERKCGVLFVTLDPLFDRHPANSFRKHAPTSQDIDDNPVVAANISGVSKLGSSLKTVEMFPSSELLTLSSAFFIDNVKDQTTKICLLQQSINPKLDACTVRIISIGESGLGEAFDQDFLIPKRLKKSRKFQGKWIQNLERMLITCENVLFFLDFKWPTARPVVYGNVFDSISKFSSGQVIEVSLEDSKATVKKKSDDENPSTSKDSFVLGIDSSMVPTRIYVWRTDMPSEMEIYSGPNKKEIVCSVYHRRYRRFIAASLKDNRIQVLRPKPTFWGESMYPARFQIIDSNEDNTTDGRRDSTLSLLEKSAPGQDTVAPVVASASTAKILQETESPDEPIEISSAALDRALPTSISVPPKLIHTGGSWEGTIIGCVVCKDSTTCTIDGHGNHVGPSLLDSSKFITFLSSRPPRPMQEVQQTADNVTYIDSDCGTVEEGSFHVLGFRNENIPPVFPTKDSLPLDMCEKSQKSPHAYDETKTSDDRAIVNSASSSTLGKSPSISSEAFTDAGNDPSPDYALAHAQFLRACAEKRRNRLPDSYIVGIYLAIVSTEDDDAEFMQKEKAIVSAATSDSRGQEQPHAHIEAFARIQASAWRPMRSWTKEEDNDFIQRFAENPNGTWHLIASYFHKATPADCFARAFLLLGAAQAFGFDACRYRKAPSILPRRDVYLLLALLNIPDKSDAGIIMSVDLAKQCCTIKYREDKIDQDVPFASLLRMGRLVRTIPKVGWKVHVLIPRFSIEDIAIFMPRHSMTSIMSVAKCLPWTSKEDSALLKATGNAESNLEEVLHSLNFGRDEDACLARYDHLGIAPNIRPWTTKELLWLSRALKKSNRMTWKRLLYVLKSGERTTDDVVKKGLVLGYNIEPLPDSKILLRDSKENADLKALNLPPREWDDLTEGEQNAWSTIALNSYVTSTDIRKEEQKRLLQLERQKLREEQKRLLQLERQKLREQKAKIDAEKRKAQADVKKEKEAQKRALNALNATKVKQKEANKAKQKTKQVRSLAETKLNGKPAESPVAIRGSVAKWHYVEEEILVLMMKAGYSKKDISSALGRSERTIQARYSDSLRRVQIGVWSCKDFMKLIDMRDAGRCEFAAIAEDLNKLEISCRLAYEYAHGTGAMPKDVLRKALEDVDNAVSFSAIGEKFNLKAASFQKVFYKLNLHLKRRKDDDDYDALGRKQNQRLLDAGGWEELSKVAYRQLLSHHDLEEWCKHASRFRVQNPAIERNKVRSQSQKNPAVVRQAQPTKWNDSSNARLLSMFEQQQVTWNDVLREFAGFSADEIYAHLKTIRSDPVVPIANQYDGLREHVLNSYSVYLGHMPNASRFQIFCMQKARWRRMSPEEKLKFNKYAYSEIMGRCNLVNKSPDPSAFATLIASLIPEAEKMFELTFGTQGTPRCSDKYRKIAHAIYACLPERIDLDILYEYILKESTPIVTGAEMNPKDKANQFLLDLSAHDNVLYQNVLRILGKYQSKELDKHACREKIHAALAQNPDFIPVFDQICHAKEPLETTPTKSTDMEVCTTSINHEKIAPFPDDTRSPSYENEGCEGVRTSKDRAEPNDSCKLNLASHSDACVAASSGVKRKGCSKTGDFAYSPIDKHKRAKQSISERKDAYAESSLPSYPGLRAHQPDSREHQNFAPPSSLMPRSKTLILYDRNDVDDELPISITEDCNVLLMNDG